MGKFRGFRPINEQGTVLPGAFFTELLGQIQDATELKLLLYIFWRLGHKEGRFPFVTRSELRAAAGELGLTGPQQEPDLAALDRALELSTERGTLLAQSAELEGQSETLYFLNSARGRAAAEGLGRGDWSPAEESAHPPRITPSVFRLYEENFGPLTPMISEELAEAEQAYPYEWIDEAMRIAVANNVRRWRYVEAILRSWQDKGKDDGQSRKGAEEDRHKYIRGEFSEFIEH